MQTVLLGGPCHGKLVQLGEPASPQLEVPVPVRHTPMLIGALDLSGPFRFETTSYRRKKLWLPIERDSWDVELEPPPLWHEPHPLLQYGRSRRFVWIHDSFRPDLQATMDALLYSAEMMFGDTARDASRLSHQRLDAWDVYVIAKREPKKLRELLPRVERLDQGLDELDKLLAGMP